MCSPVFDHQILCGWQYFLGTVKSQYECSGMQAVNVASAIKTCDTATIPNRIWPARRAHLKVKRWM
jgi:hypothetical protein